MTVNISENPYMQYFIGFHSFKEGKPFDSSLLVHFRKRLGKDVINKINELIAKADIKMEDDSDNDNNQSGGGNSETENKESSEEKEHKKDETQENCGKLILDATCVPADVHYPTDLWLLNKAREALEEIIDVLHEPHIGKVKKPRTYRNVARKEYLRIEKNRRPSKKQIRRAIGKQLGYIKRDLEAIAKLLDISSLKLLTKKQYKNLLVCSEIYRQQNQMHESKTHKIEDRIISLHMPFVRPVKRGKTNASVEFGPKLSISVVQGYAFMEKLEFNPYNEGISLADSVEQYKERFDVYPESVMADKIYRNRENIRYCKERNIRLNGPPLGRPSLDEELRKELRRQEVEDSKIRNSVEGKFGEGKRIYGLGRLFTRLEDTSETVIAVNLLVMNLEKRLRVLFVQIFRRIFGRYGKMQLLTLRG